MADDHEGDDANFAARDVWTAAQGINLAGRRVLVVEDEILVATAIECEVVGAGAEVVGPAYTLDEALELSQGRVDIAVLDINLGDHKVWPVAKTLGERGIPYVFASANAFGAQAIPEPFASAPRFDKPVRMTSMLRKLAEMTPKGN